MATYRPRIVHVINDLDVGGAEVSLLKLLEGSNRLAANHSVISLDFQGALVGEFRAIGISVLELGLRDVAGWPRSAAALRRFVLMASPSTVVGWMYHGNIAALLLRNTLARQARLVWNVRHSVYDIADEKLGTRAMIRLGARWSRSVDAIVFNSAVSRAQHVCLGYGRERTQVVPNGFDVNAVRHREALRCTWRTRFNWQDRNVVIGMIARAHPVKDHVTLIHALRELRVEHPALRAVFVGRDVDTPGGAIGRLIAEAGLGDVIQLVQETRDISGVLSALDIFCLSSRGEGFPNVLGEAMCHGLPCVASDVGGVRELLGDVGVIVRPGDAKQLASELSRLTSMSVDARKAMGSAARQRVVEKFSLGVSVKKFEAIWLDPDALTVG